MIIYAVFVLEKTRFKLVVGDLIITSHAQTYVLSTRPYSFASVTIMRLSCKMLGMPLKPINRYLVICN